MQLEELADLFQVTQLSMFKTMATLELDQYITSEDGINYHVDEKSFPALRSNLKSSFSHLSDEEYRKIDQFLLEYTHKHYEMDLIPKIAALEKIVNEQGALIKKLLKSNLGKQSVRKSSPTRKIKDIDVNEILELKAQGKTHAEISSIIGISPTSINRKLNEHKELQGQISV